MVRKSFLKQFLTKHFIFKKSIFSLKLLQKTGNLWSEITAKMTQTWSEITAKVIETWFTNRHQ